MNDDRQLSSRRDSLKPFIWLCVGVVVVHIGFGVAVWQLISLPADRGTFGDMFGAVNSLFSGLAFIGVVYAILLQRKELQLQREELVLTRDEVAKAATAQENIANVQRETAMLLETQASNERERHRISLLPILYLKSSGGIGVMRFTLLNRGPAALNLTAIFRFKGGETKKESRNYLTEADSWEWKSLVLSEAVACEVKFTDSLGTAYMCAVEVEDYPWMLCSPTLKQSQPSKLNPE